MPPENPSVDEVFYNPKLNSGLDWVVEFVRQKNQALKA